MLKSVRISWILQEEKFMEAMVHLGNCRQSDKSLWKLWCIWETADKVIKVHGSYGASGKLQTKWWQQSQVSCVYC